MIISNKNDTYNCFNNLKSLFTKASFLALVHFLIYISLFITSCKVIYSSK